MSMSAERVDEQVQSALPDYQFAAIGCREEL
jgi:hypothetical protein